MFDELTIGWAAFRKQLGRWLALGGLIGLISYLTDSAFGWLDARFTAIAVFGFGVVSHAVILIIEAGLYAIALAQLRQDTFEVRRFADVFRHSGAIVGAAIASFVSFSLLRWVAEGTGDDGRLFSYVVWPLLCIPFALSMPMILDSGLNPVKAIWEGFRWAIRHYFRVLAIEVAIVTVCAVPMGFLLFFASLSNIAVGAGSSLLSIGVLLIAAAAMQPICTLAFSALYLRYRREKDSLPVKSDHGSPTFNVPG